MDQYKQKAVLLTNVETEQANICLGTLGLRVRDGWLIAVVYVSLVVLNVLVLTEGVWRHLYRYIAAG